MRLKKAGNYLLVVFVVISHLAVAQFRQAAQWTDDGNAIYQNREGAIVKTDIKTQVETTVISTSIAYWQVDANKIRDYFMLNTTDSNYSQVIPVEYPKVGEAPSPVKIGVVSVKGALPNGWPYPETRSSTTCHGWNGAVQAL